MPNRNNDLVAVRAPLPAKPTPAELALPRILADVTVLISKRQAAEDRPYA